MINFRIILKLMALLLIIEGCFMFFCVPVAFYYKESLMPSLLSGFITIGVGGLLFLFNYKAPTDIGKREGYIIVTVCWLFFSVLGSLPFIFSGSIPSFTDAFFETMSGFTTTGASILNDIESLPYNISFWRCLTQWIGGMGIIVLSLAVLPILGIGGMQLFIAEVPGPSPDKIHPRIKETAKRLWGIYIIFTALETALLMFGGMNLFDAICHSFTTMATGGYSTKQASVAHWDSPFIHYVIAVFMFAAGTNFTLSYFAMHFKFDKVFKNEEFRYYSGLVILFTLIVAVGLFFSTNLGIERSFRDAFFQVVSLITTTGFATADYMIWSPFLVLVMFICLFFGGSAGSTGGGVKIVRVLLFFKNSYLELKRILHPNALVPVRLNEKVVMPEILSNIIAFVSFYLLVYISGVLVIGALGSDLETALGAVAATLGNIGPGIGKVGPVENYFHFSPAAKWVLSFLMLIGRLELFTVLILLTPAFWRK